MNTNNPKPMTFPSLVGEKIYLRPATAEDIANTHHWSIQSEPQNFSCHPITIYTSAEAAERFKTGERSPDKQTFMIIRKTDNILVGRIRFFNMNTLNRSVELGLIIDPDERKKGYALEATRILCRYLIKTLGMNKVYAQTASFNDGAKKLMEKSGFKKDGTLRHHYFWKGEFYDGLLYSQLAFEFEG